MAKAGERTGYRLGAAAERRLGRNAANEDAEAEDDLDDDEEERRVLHVGVTRGRHRVALLADATRPSPFLAELAGTAPIRALPATAAAMTAPR